MQRRYLAALTRRSGHSPGSALPRLAALARLAPLALLLLLAAGRGSEQGRRWAAPVVLRSLAARSASAARFVPSVFSSSFFVGARVFSSYGSLRNAVFRIGREDRIDWLRRNQTRNGL